MSILAIVIVFVALVAPYAIIGGLTKFQPEQSTKTQRGWTMAWLVVGQLYGAFLPLYDESFEQMSQQHERYENFAMPVWLTKLLFVCSLGIPAIGGFVIVGMMIRDYGSYCVDV